ncbi:MAG: 3-isopropylmalate dehydratase small subunit [Spirochaetota bacterium]
MTLDRIVTRSGRAVPVPGDDIDTDRIIPARFMKCVTFDGLGEFLFYDSRKDEHGHDTDHPLNLERYTNARIIITGANFGCGSSREHAPQAIARAGFTAIIAEGFGEIFFGNCVQLGMPCVTVSHEDRKKLTKSVEEDPAQEIIINLESKSLTYSGGSVSFDIPEAAAYALMNGSWDPLQDLMANIDKADAVAEKLGYV